MSIVENLLMLYAGILFINIIISAILWIHDKAPLYRSVFFLWLTSILSLVIQGILTQNNLIIVIGFSSAFLINIALSYILSQITGIKVSLKLFVLLLLLCYPFTVLFYLLQFHFTLMALPVVFAVAFPALFTGVKILFTKWNEISISAKALSISTCFLALHNIDFAFLRLVDSLVPIGFCIVIVIIFCLSIFAPAVVLEVLKEKQSTLKELDRLKSLFFANISHEIRTPLTMMLSPIEAALQGEYGKKIDDNFLKNLHRNAIRLLQLINNLLDFSKLEAGRMRMRVQEIDIVKLIKIYIGMVHSAFEVKGIKLDFISLNESVFLYLDLEKMDKIGMNLLSNALKFNEKEGEVKTRIKDDEKNCYIDFEDSGVGIPKEKIDSIFNRFSQADSTSSRKNEGTGIGLALVKEYVEMHGGAISVKSKYIEEYPDNHGTTCITLPKGKKHLENREEVDFLSDSELEESVTDHRIIDVGEIKDLDVGEDKTDSGVLDKKTTSFLDILVVEDNHDLRNFLKFLLEKHYVVHTAVNGEEGLKMAGQLKPDLVVSDVMMPVMNGYTMTKKIKETEELKRIPVLMLTAKAEVSHKIEGLEYGADDYLTKPFNAKELLARIKSLIKLKQLQDELSEMNKKLTAKVEDQLNTIKKTDEIKRYLPPQLVDAIIKGEKKVSFETERKKLTVFFSDIKGFSNSTDALESEDLSSILNDYITAMTMIANKWGGTIDKFIGDAIMIFFGAPEIKPDIENALACVKMALEMQEKMEEFHDKWFHLGIENPFKIRIGINTGTATVGNFGTEDRLSYTAIGTHVNLSSRLQELAEPGGILISHSTWALVSDEIKCKERGKVKVRGIHKEILCYDVVM